jgi:biopolymer transport protein ExbB
MAEFQTKDYRKMKTLKPWIVILALLLPGFAQAWWNADWTHRKKITINTPADVKQPIAQVAVPVRLHTGNFLFTDAQQSGADLRFIASDDKTPLKFHIERFDDVNELAIVWVQLPKIAPGGAPESIWMYYGNAKAPAGDDPKGTYDQNQIAVLHFSEKQGLPQDQTAYANNPGQSTAAIAPSGMLDGGVSFNGQARIVFPVTPSLQLKSAGGFTFSTWIKPADAQKNAVLFSQVDGKKSITIGIADGHVTARVTNGEGSAVEAPRDTQLTPAAWHHVVVTIKDKVAVYVDGKQGASVAVSLADMSGEIVVGAGFKGDMDELELANIERPADWISAAFEGQGASGKLLTVGEPEDTEAGGGSSYFGILLHAVTLDGWVVIGILMVMMVIAFCVMVGKSIFISQMERANEAFRAQFKRLSGELVSIDRGNVDDEDEDEEDDEPIKVRRAAMAGKLGSVGAMAAQPVGHKGKGVDEFKHSSLYRIYHVGVRELQHRFDLYEKAGQSRSLSAQAIGAIKASVDAGLVRELHRLNSQMVLLTIAISGGPFLGLLGTVVGVMITFAAIAAAGDVNVNSIAPGIAAALVATVAGLGVAIPALFGYNYLASRIKSITADMQVFVDEFITKLAEDYAP